MPDTGAQMTDTDAVQGERVAGRALDAEVAERLFGWRVAVASQPGFDRAIRVWSPDRPDTKGRLYAWNNDDPATLTAGDFDTQLPHYSTDFEATVKVVDETVRRGFTWAGRHLPVSSRVHWEFRRTGSVWADVADTTPLVICRAALAALDAADPS
jgi:hypothetical protein